MRPFFITKRGFLPKTAKFSMISSKLLVSVRLGDKIDFENRPCWLGNLLNIHNIRNWKKSSFSKNK